jgi:hypothetical protein
MTKTAITTFMSVMLLSFLSAAHADEGAVRVTMVTSQGDIVIDLYPDKAETRRWWTS